MTCRAEFNMKWMFYAVILQTSSPGHAPSLWTLCGKRRRTCWRCGCIKEMILRYLNKTHGNSWENSVCFYLFKLVNVQFVRIHSTCTACLPKLGNLEFEVAIFNYHLLGHGRPQICKKGFNGKLKIASSLVNHIQVVTLNSLGILTPWSWITFFLIRTVDSELGNVEQIVVRTVHSC